MTEIYSFPPDTSVRYANDQQELTKFNTQYPRTSLFSWGTKILDVVRKPLSIVLLFQTDLRKSWAGIEPPANFYVQFFSQSPYIAPSLGSQEKQAADIEHIQSFIETKGPEFKKNAEDLVNFLKTIVDINNTVDYINARRNQFAKG